MTAPLRTRQVTTAPSESPRSAAADVELAAPRFAPRTAPPAGPSRRLRGPQAPPAGPPRRLRGPQAPPALRVVNPAADRQRRVNRVVTAVLVAAICVGLFSIVALRVMLAQGQVEVDRLQATVDAQRAAQQQLRLTVAELEAPAQIVSAARSRLGMVNPGAVVYLSPPPAPPR